ncbi:MAG TPA: hypothetical protein PLO50_14035 [Nitrospira sp.]|nr:hypothetical protein [Nitrospira sp.]
MGGAVLRFVSGVGASMCSEGKEEGVGEAVTDTVGTGVASTCLSCDRGGGGRGKDEALGGSGVVMKAAVGCVRGSIAVGSGVGIGIG